MGKERRLGQENGLDELGSHLQAVAQWPNGNQSLSEEISDVTAKYVEGYNLNDD